MFVLLILAGATVCATLQATATQSTEQMLAAAGFHAEAADTPELVAELQSLPARQLVRRLQDGAVSYKFADPAGATASTSATNESTVSISGSEWTRNAPTRTR